MKRLLLVAALGSAAAFTGCARARVTTEIRPDGSFTRTDTFTGQGKSDGSMVPSIEDTFLLPTLRERLSAPSPPADR